MDAKPWTSDPTWSSENTWASEHTWASAKTQPAAPGATIDIGDQLGPYRLVTSLGSGGMGTVFVGEHTLIGRRVALKVLHPDYALKPEIARRFMMEARLANSIASESVIQVDDFVRTPEGLCYLVMELLEGADLAATVVTDGFLPVARCLPIVRQVAEALEAAHKAHIVHRDLKPENIFLVRKGERRDVVKLLDFGLAKLSESQGNTGVLTTAGTIIGTPTYMSPEQAFGLNIDHRTDIFALGVVLYWLLAGQLPFQGEGLQGQREARYKPAPPLPPTTPGGEVIPEPLVALVAQCLALEANSRPATMRVVIERIDAIAKLPVTAGAAPAPVALRPVAPKPAAEPDVRPRRSPLLGVAVVAALALLGAGGWLFAHRTVEEPEAPLPSEPATVNKTPTANELPAPPPAPTPAPAIVPPAAAQPTVAATTEAPTPRAQRPTSIHPSHRRPPRAGGLASPAAQPKTAAAPGHSSPPPDAFAPLPDR